MSILAENIKRLRVNAGMTQQKLADSLSISQKNVDSWENRGIKPSHEKLLLLSQLFGLTIEEIVTGSKNPIYSTKQEFFMKYSSSPQHIKKAINILLKL